MGLPNNRVYSQIDTFTISNVDTIHIPTPEKYHSPHKATFYSAIIPGMGQAYNKQYWKIPILYAGLGGIIYGISFNTKYYNKYKNAYRDYIIKDPANKSYLEFAYKAGLTEDDINNADWFEQALKNKKDYYKRNRDFSYIGLLAIYVLNLVDASVDAHFYNYDISDDLTLRIEPTLLNFNSPITETQGFGLQLRLQF
ncbi:MAG: hypothetical protein JW717_08980 [Marinilabiliaceae bacterium]|nr:hypothetical protein [Marinilabiliaceae bacterium]